MPTWKKIIVSGSKAELAEVSSSSGLRIGTNQQITTAQATTFLTGSFSGSFRGDGSGLTNVSVGNLANSLTQGTGITAFTFNGSAAQTVSVSGSTTLSTNSISKWTGAAFANSSLTDDGTNITGTTSIQLTGTNSRLSGSFSGSFQGLHSGNGSGLTNIPTSAITFAASGFVSASQLNTSTTQGTVVNVVNGVSQSAALLNLGTGDTPTFNGLIVSTNALQVNNANGITTNAATFPIAPSATTINLGTTTNTAINIGTAASTVTIPGNLTVAGSTITFNTENLTVSDKFILLASGSTSPTDGGIIISNAANNTGSAFYYDGADTRWAVAPVAASTATAIVANSYVVTVSGSNANPSGNPLYGSADASRIGAMYINTTSGDESIWIWS